MSQGDEPKSYLHRVTSKYGFNVKHSKGLTVFVHPKIERAFDYRHNEIFICNIPEDCREESLLHLFVRIPGLFKFRFYYKEDDTPKGHAIAQYTTVAGAVCAIRRLHGTKLRGHTLKVVHSITSKQLIIGNINEARVPFDVDMDDYVTGYFNAVIPYYRCISANPCEGKPTMYVADFFRFKDADVARKQLLIDRIEVFGTKCFVHWDDQ